MEKLKVLVVDDEPGIRSGINRILRGFRVDYPFMDDDIGFDILEAEDGEIALSMIKEHHPEVILLDNKLPGEIQGIDVLEKINKDQMEILVMMITSHASLEVAVKATKNGAFDFVPKPFTPQELKSSMENITKHFFLKRMTQQMNREGRQIRFQFLSILSHELKTPLNAIEGYLRMMQDKQLGESLDDYSKPIARSLNRVAGMRNLIMDMLDLTQIESGKKKREFTEVDLETIAKSAIDTMMPYAIQKDVSINLETSKCISLFADEDEMEIILNNLISNAVKYNVPGGKVNCALKCDEKFIIISVEDTGVGISEANINKLFEEFVRIKNPKTKDTTGSGLGLSIVKKIADMYSGEIRVESEPDKGSVFEVCLPRKSNDTE